MKAGFFKIFAVTALCISLCIVVYAAKAVSSVVNFIQPDGSVVPVRMYGDEFFSYKKNMAGFLVEQGPDGFLYYANYNAGELSLSGNRVTSVPENVRYSLREQNLFARRGGQVAVKSAPLRHFLQSRTKLSAVMIKTPVLLVEFSDVKFTVADVYSEFHAQLNRSGYSVNGSTGSAADYFTENLRGRANFIFEVFPKIITLKHPKEYYGADASNMVDGKIRELFADVCKAAYEGGIDFSAYDWLGDGVVKNVSIIYAGYSQSETGNTADIWPQYHVVDNIAYQGKKIAAFGCSPELTAMGLLKGKISGIGTFCHEFAHALGLPDMYDTNGDNEGAGIALCKSLSLMDEGNYLNYGRTPPYFTAIERELLGDKPLVPVPGEGLSILSTSSGGEMYRIDSNNEGEYFLFECRSLSGWDRYIGGEGMIVYHVDKSSLVYGGIASQKRWDYNNINSYGPHQCATVFAASAIEQGQLENLFFPGLSGVNSLTAYGKTKFLDWSGTPLGINIADISFKNDIVRCSVVPGQIYDESVPSPVFSKISIYQYDCRIDWGVPGGAQMPEGKWRVRWRPLTGEQNHAGERELQTDKTYCYINSLTPNTNYQVSVVFEKGNLYGREGKLTFISKAITSDMPYISIKGEYKVGEILDLRALNMVEEYSGMEWYINSVRIDACNYELKKQGTFTIEAIIKYNDGSQESIVKKIKVVE